MVTKPSSNTLSSRWLRRNPGDVEKRGYSPPPVPKVQRPAPPPAGPRRQPSGAAPQRPRNDGEGR